MSYLQICALCYSKWKIILYNNYLDAKSSVLSSCGCLFCINCVKILGEKKIQACPTCKCPLNYQKFLNLKEKKDAAKVMFLFEDPETQLKKFQQALKFQKKQQNQYISFLENKIKTIMRENSNLRKSINAIHNNIPRNSLTQNINVQNNVQKNINVDNNQVCNTPNIANITMKKIEIKPNNEMQSSSKYSPYIYKYEENLNNIKNLNAQTASEQQYLNKNGGNINVNINNNNSNRRNSPYVNNLSSNRNNNRSIDRGGYIKNNFNNSNNRNRY